MPSHYRAEPDDEARQKTTLFCPECDHESDITGDWIVYEEDDRQIYECPVCGTTITKRCRSSTSPARKGDPLLS